VSFYVSWPAIGSGKLVDRLLNSRHGVMQELDEDLDPFRDEWT